MSAERRGSPEPGNPPGLGGARGGSDPVHERPATTRGLRGAVAVLVGSGASLLLQLVALAILSRLLAPSDFGLIAMVTVFVTLGSLIRDFGLPTAGLQMARLSPQQATNLFWMNTAIAAATAIALLVSVPLLVTVFDEPRLAGIVPALAAVILMGGISAQVQLNLVRKMRFLTITVADVASQMIGLGVAIWMAASGAGYWALVAQSLLVAFFGLALRWFASRWMPGLPRRGHGSVSMFRSGAEYGFAQFLTFAQNNIDTLVIGAHLGATQLGYYNRAYQILSTPAARLLDPLTQVVVTTLNRVKNSGRDPEPLLLKAQVAVGTFVVLLFAVTAGTAHLLVPLLLGPHWSEVITVFQVLAIGGSVWAFNHVSYWGFIVTENSRGLLRYNLVSKPLAVLLILIGAQFGIIGVAWGYSFAMVFSWPLNLVWLARTSGLHALRFAANGLRILGFGIVVAAAALATSLLLQGRMPDLIVVIIGALSGTAIMLILTAAFPRTRADLSEWFGFAKASFGKIRKGGYR